MLPHANNRRRLGVLLPQAIHHTIYSARAFRRAGLSGCCCPATRNDRPYICDDMSTANSTHTAKVFRASLGCSRDSVPGACWAWAPDLRAWALGAAKRQCRQRTWASRFIQSLRPPRHATCRLSLDPCPGRAPYCIHIQKKASPPPKTGSCPAPAPLLHHGSACCWLSLAAVQLSLC